MADHHVICRHCGVGINYTCECDDPDPELLAEIKRSAEAYRIQYDRAEAAVLARNEARSEANLFHAEIERLRGLLSEAVPLIDRELDDDQLRERILTALRAKHGD